MIEAANMLGHNQGAWTMPGPLEDYIAHFNEADAAARRLKVALHDLQTKVAQAVQAPQTLSQPASGKWPTQDELRALYVELQAKTAPLMAEYNQLAQEYRQYAPQPQTVGGGSGRIVV